MKLAGEVGAPRDDRVRMRSGWAISSWLEFRSCCGPRDSRSGFWRRSRVAAVDRGNGRRRFRRRWLSLRQASVLTVVIEYFGVAAPIGCGFKLAFHFFFGKVFVENV